ncbi:MAG TPA: GAF domain-containing protein, partial [Opitutaceae bacterium]|nr:GAF domain-containing protein [Opitutaceae bacterium]
MATSSLANTLRRSLLIKIISKPAPSREDINSVVELTASKVVEALQAQSMTIYIVEGNDITFKHVYYSPTLWAINPRYGEYFQELSEKLLATKLPLGTGNVGKVIATAQPLFFTKNGPDASSLLSMAKTTGFDVQSMLTVPLKTNIVIGAIQVLNKEPSAGTNGEFTQR